MKELELIACNEGFRMVQEPSARHLCAETAAPSPKIGDDAGSAGSLKYTAPMIYEYRRNLLRSASVFSREAICVSDVSRIGTR